MFRDQRRYGRDPNVVVRATKATFEAPLHWAETGFVFTCSWSDWFIEEADAWRDEAWEIIRRTPHLTYQILTKRPERIAMCLPRTCFRCGLTADVHPGLIGPLSVLDPHDFEGWPWPNVWLGTSVEDQERAEERIPKLVTVPAVVHFLSCEPLLAPIDFGTRLDPPSGFHATEDGRIAVESIVRAGLLVHIEWVIVGGESEPGGEYREMDPAWARLIRDQCEMLGVPFFFKQSSGPRSEMNPVLDGKEWREMPRVGT
jgi:protein gp37